MGNKNPDPIGYCGACGRPVHEAFRGIVTFPHPHTGQTMEGVTEQLAFSVCHDERVYADEKLTLFADARTFPAGALLPIRRVRLVLSSEAKLAERQRAIEEEPKRWRKG